MRAAIAATVFLALLPASARGGAANPIEDARARFASEPTVAQLQRAAERAAGLAPGRALSWERRARVSSIAPILRVQARRGGGELLSATDLDGSTKIIAGGHDSWQIGASATWALDRIVFQPEELRVAREAQRMAVRRERLLTEVARVYFERRRLQLAIALAPPRDPVEAESAGLRLEELSATLDALTDGALRRATSAPTSAPDLREPGPPVPAVPEGELP